MPIGTATYRNHLAGNVTHTASPAHRRLIQHIVYAEPLILSRQRIQILLKQYILLGDIRKDQVDLGAVARRAAADDSLHNLQHGRDARAAGDHAKVANEVGPVVEGALGPTHADRLRDGQRGHVLADVAGRVRLDQQVEEARELVAADGRVAAHDLLVAAVGLVENRADGDVLADGEAEDVRRAGEGETVAGGVGP